MAGHIQAELAFRRLMDFVIVIGLLIVGFALTALARRAGGPSTDRFVNLDPTRGDYSIATSQRAAELGEIDRCDEQRPKN